MSHTWEYMFQGHGASKHKMICVFCILTCKESSAWKIWESLSPVLDFFKYFLFRSFFIQTCIALWKWMYWQWFYELHGHFPWILWKNTELSASTNSAVSHHTKSLRCHYSSRKDNCEKSTIKCGKSQMLISSMSHIPSVGTSWGTPKHTL